MNNDKWTYNLQILRCLLRASFTTGGLRRFCQDRPIFRPIVDHFAPEQSLVQMVDRVITYCEKKYLLDELVDEVKKVNPKQYKRFEEGLGAPKPSDEVEEVTPNQDRRVEPGRTPPPPDGAKWRRYLLGLVAVLGTIAVLLVVGALVAPGARRWLGLAATDTPMPTAMPTIAPTMDPTSAPSLIPTYTPALDVIISDVYNEGRAEHVVIYNGGASEVDLSGWQLEDSDKNMDAFVFPAGFVLEPNVEVRVYSGGEGHEEMLPDSFSWTKSNVWDNDGETAYLFDAQGNLVDEYEY